MLKLRFRDLFLIAATIAVPASFFDTGILAGSRNSRIKHLIVSERFSHFRFFLIAAGTAELQRVAILRAGRFINGFSKIMSVNFRDNFFLGCIASVGSALEYLLTRCGAGSRHSHRAFIPGVGNHLHFFLLNQNRFADRALFAGGQTDAVAGRRNRRNFHGGVLQHGNFFRLNSVFTANLALLACRPTNGGAGRCNCGNIFLFAVFCFRLNDYVIGSVAVLALIRHLARFAVCRENRVGSVRFKLMSCGKNHFCVTALLADLGSVGCAGCIRNHKAVSVARRDFLNLFANGAFSLTGSCAGRRGNDLPNVIAVFAFFPRVRLHRAAVFALLFGDLLLLAVCRFDNHNLILMFLQRLEVAQVILAAIQAVVAGITKRSTGRLDSFSILLVVLVCTRSLFMIVSVINFCCFGECRHKSCCNHDHSHEQGKNSSRNLFHDFLIPPHFVLPAKRRRFGLKFLLMKIIHPFLFFVKVVS